jgi:hypothetical protein
MKIYQLLAVLATAVLMMTSCAVHDPFADNMEIGIVLPTVSWEQSSVTIKAGNYAGFKAMYYTSSENEIDHCAVWALSKRTDEAAATSRLTTSLSYTKTITTVDTVRRQEMATYPHSKAVWDGYEYVLADSFPTSKTMEPKSWSNPEQWDEAKFKEYYPPTFKEEFCAYLIKALTKDSTYYNDLRSIYINYDFTQEQFEALNAKYNVNFPTVTESGEKSDAWFTTDEIDHYYYVTVDNGVTTIHEIPTQEQAPSGVNVYQVYKSSPWLICRYSDDTGGKITNVRREYMPYWKELLEQIPFTAWIYNTAEKTYSVNFSRTYTLNPDFRVYDKATGKAGVTSDNKEISLN